MKLQRREMLLASLGIPAGFAELVVAAQAPAASAEPAALAAGDGELVYVGRDPVRIKVTAPAGKGRFAMITQDVGPGTNIPIHAHDKEDEIIFIQSGTGEATIAGKTVQLAAGSMLFVPQGTWHGGRNTSSEILKWVAIYSPSGFEGYFREIGRARPDDPPRPSTPDERAARDLKYAIRYQR
jgi:quercetin dioxygenase-like cupin family protein